MRLTDTDSLCVENMSIGRKLFRLFKFFNEYATIKKTMAGDGKPADKYLTCATRLMFALYWVFDNLGVLIKIKFIKSMDMAATLKKANTFWLLGLILTLIGAVKKLIELSAQAAKLRIDKANVGKDGGMDESAYKEAVATLKNNQKTSIFTIIKALGDTTTASQGLGYPKMILGFDFNDGVVGLGGFTSAALTCYQTYPK